MISKVWQRFKFVFDDPYQKWWQGIVCLSILILATWNTSVVALQKGLAEIGPKQLVGNEWKNAPLAEKTLFYW